MAQTVLIALILSFASFLQGITGFGFALLAAPLLYRLTGPQDTVYLNPLYLLRYR